MEEGIVGDEFRLRRKIGAGSFGEIYAGESIKTHRRVAIKIESIDTHTSQLPYESKLYQLLQGGTGIPNFYWFGKNHEHNILVIDLLGKSLENLFEKCNHKFSLKTVLMLAEQMISLLQFFHSKNLIHRDIKPDNFVIGFGSKSNQIFIIDYGLAKRYRNPFSNQHIPFATNKSLTGTARYASVRALKGNEQSRRDDLEALGYIFLYFLRGKLPWMGIKCDDQEEKFRLIGEVKEQTSFEELCEGYPNEFLQYFQMVRQLEFDETPLYSEYRQLFRNLFINSGYVYDYKYDWIVTEIPNIKIPCPLKGNEILNIPNEKTKTDNQDKRRKRLDLQRNQSHPIIKDHEKRISSAKRPINQNQHSKQPNSKAIPFQRNLKFRSEKDLLQYSPKIEKYQLVRNPSYEKDAHISYKHHAPTNNELPTRGQVKLSKNLDYIGNTDKSNKANSQSFSINDFKKNNSQELSSTEIFLRQKYPSYNRHKNSEMMINNDYVGHRSAKHSTSTDQLHSNDNLDLNLDSEDAVQKLIDEARIANQKYTPAKDDHK